MRPVVAVTVAFALFVALAHAEDRIGGSSEPTGLVGTEPPHLRTECAVNLVEMGKRLHAFAVTRGGVLPSKLSEAYIGTSKSVLGELVCPSARPDVVPGGFRPAYACVNVAPGGWAMQERTADIFVFDREPVHDGGRNVLLADLETVVYMKEADFQAALVEQQRRWKLKDKELLVIEHDFIPLKDPLARRPAVSGRTWHSFFASVHFKIATTLMLAIATITIILLLRKRERDRAASR